jgi:hypothetical protein
MTEEHKPSHEHNAGSHEHHEHSHEAGAHEHAHAAHEHQAASHEHHEGAHEHHADHAEHHADSKIGQDIPAVDLKKINAAALKSGLTDVIDILKLNKSKIGAVAGRESEGINIALVYLLIGAIGAPLGGAILGYSIFGARFTTPLLTALISCLVAAVIAALTIYVMNFVAIKFFKGKGVFAHYFRVMGYAYLLNVLGFLTVIPFLGSLASIYMLVVAFVTLKEVHKLDAANSVLTLLVTIGVFIVLTYLLALIGLSGTMMSWGGAGAGYSHMVVTY